VQLVALVVYNPVLGDLVQQPCYNMVEFFAGTKAVFTAFINAGLAAAYYDKEYDPVSQNILFDAGFIFALVLVLMTFPGGLLMFETLCSSWTRVNVHTSGRSSMKPLGNIHYGYVVDGNVMVARVSALKVVGIACGHWWFLEQPGGSSMDMHPTEQYLMGWDETFKWGWNMESFGKNSLKPQIGHSNKKEIETLSDHYIPLEDRPKQRVNTSVSFVDRSGQRRFTGDPAKLKASQIYPKAFGVALLRLYIKFRHRFEAQAAALHAITKVLASPNIVELFCNPRRERSDKIWKLAKLSGIREVLLRELPDPTGGD
jgi:hypothetical protein